MLSFVSNTTGAPEMTTLGCLLQIDVVCNDHLISLASCCVHESSERYVCCYHIVIRRYYREELKRHYFDSILHHTEKQRSVLVMGCIPGPPQSPLQSDQSRV